VCQIELSGYTSEGLSAFLNRVKSVTKKKLPTESNLKLSQKTQAGTTGNTKWARDDAKDFDGAFLTGKKIKGLKESFNWAETHSKGFKVGEGAYGTAIMVDGKLGKPGYVVKRGEVSTTEASIIKKLGESDIGPKLLYAELAKGKPKVEYGKNFVTGRIAMTRVPGKDYGEFDNNTDKVGKTTVGDAYWFLRSQLHRLGIAHNDSHSGNVLIDDKGKARFVDLGLAQSNPRAALSEALGVFTARRFFPEGASASSGRGDGDFQAKGQPQYGVRDMVNGREAPANLLRMRDNLKNVFSEMRTAGFSDNDIADIMASKIRRPDSSYERGTWKNMTDETAKKLIDTLYDGVKDFS
jgi:hypothetical protein